MTLAKLVPDAILPRILELQLGSFSGRGRTFLDVKLHGRHHVAIEISALDGRPQLRACDSGKGAAPLAASGIANQPRDARLRAASEQLHDNPHLLVDILQKLRLQVS